MKHRESRAVKHLLSQSGQPYKGLSAGLEELDISGWRKVRARAVYNLNPPARRQHRSLGASRPHRARPPGQAVTEEGSALECMSGELDEDFNYHYSKVGTKRKDSTQSTEPVYPPLPPPPPPTSYYRYRAPSTVHLDPLFPYHSANLEADERLDLAKIVALQLKPELLIEQIIIENKLRTMNIGKLHHLNLEGVGVDPRSIHELDRGVWAQGVKSKSTPLLSGLRTQHRKTNKRKTRSRLPLDWCKLSANMSGGVGAEEMADGNNPFGGSPLDNSLLQVRASLQDDTRYRLPTLHPQAQDVSPQQVGGRYKQFQRSTLQGDPLKGGGGGGARSLHVPVVAPSLRTMGKSDDVSGLGIGTQEPLWQQNKVKHVNKLRSLGW